MKIATRTFLLVSALCLGIVVKAQITSAGLQQYLSINDKSISQTVRAAGAVKQFYSYHDFQSAWFSYGGQALRTELIDLLRSPHQWAINSPADGYFIDSALKSLNTLNDSLGAEIQLTDAVLHFISNILYGQSSPQLGYNGLRYQPGCMDIPLLVSTYLKAGKLKSLLDAIEPRSREYVSLKNEIVRIEGIMRQEHFREVTVSSTVISTSNLPLQTKLYHLGILDSPNKKISDAQLKETVKQTQRLFGLQPDGLLRTALLSRLNVPLRTRYQELKQSLNTIRWLGCLVNNEPTIVVNIPSASLLVYDRGKIILESKVIVGKRSTPTPTLSSKANEVILYPYWMVPNSIAIKELLPVIKRRPSYLDANGYQVINEQGKTISPGAINWAALGPGNFPYRIRQSTGCDNALGLIKLNFYNPYSVYLHDTPGKSLFNIGSRYFSHGCMRVEKAMELAHLLLTGNTIAVDTLEEKGCLRNQSPITVRATRPMNVFVLYNTAWFDAAGNLSFSEDVYRRRVSL